MRRVLGVLMGMSAVLRSAHAQSGDVNGDLNAIAEQLYEEGRELTKASRWAEACARFEESLKYDSQPGTKLNLAWCYEHIDKLASAWILYRESIELATKTNDAKRRTFAEQQAAALKPRLAKFAIMSPANTRTGLVVKRDGTQIEASTLRTALIDDAGPHVITASAPGFEAFTRTVMFVNGKTETLTIPDLQPATASPQAPDSAQPRAKHAPTTTLAAVPPRGQHDVAISEPVRAPWPLRKYVGVGAGIAGVATAGVGFVFGVKARSDDSDAKRLCPQLVCNMDNSDRGKQLLHDAHSNATTATVLVAAGGAAIIAGGIVFLTAPSPREHARAQIVPVAHDRSAGLAVIGSF
jgi:hypothetical protein